VRTLELGSNTYVYLVNDSPWPVTARLIVDASPTAVLELLGTRSVPGLESNGEKTLWNVTLRPYDLVAGRIRTNNVTIRPDSVTLPDHVTGGLQQRIRDIRARAEVLKNPPPVNELSNPGFEQPANGENIPGWFQSRAEGVSIEVDRAEAFRGAGSLMISTKRETAWVRSKPFDSPKTGRLAMLVWLRIADPKSQPVVRLALEAKHHGSPYYRPAPVGKSTDIPLHEEWARYYVPFDNLPTTGLSELRVGIDLMKPGEVWVDDIQLFDLPFTGSEQIELRKMIGQARLDLDNGRVSDCARLLDSYWPRFLIQHVDPVHVNIVTEPRPNLPPQAPVVQTPDQQDRSLLDRLRGMVPRMPRFY